MEENELKEKILSFVKYLFSKPELLEVKVSKKDNSWQILLFHPYEENLANRNEEVLEAIETIIRKIIFKKTKEIVPVYFDFNNLKKKKEEKLREIVRKIALKVSRTKEEITLPKMNSYQRRIVHLEIAQYPDLQTESIGEEPERRVVIKYREK